MLKKIISGGQTGADRAALAAAADCGFPFGGWAPWGFDAEDGKIPMRFQPHMMQTGMPEDSLCKRYWKRTQANVLEADATLICVSADYMADHGVLVGGTALAERTCDKLCRPSLICVIPTPVAARLIGQFIDAHNVQTLNVAGPRASKDPAIYDLTYALITSVLKEIR